MKTITTLTAAMVLAMGLAAAPAFAGDHEKNPCAMKHNPCSMKGEKKDHNPCEMKEEKKEHNPCEKKEHKD
ncbi:MAG: hypothetical protein ACE5DZ_02040 [Mariprofundus sp.]